MGDKRASPTAVKQLSRWIRSRSVRQQVSMASMAAFILLIFMKVFVKNYTYFYVAAQLAHSIGILVLIYKLTITKTCSGLSLKTQELTAIFLTMRIACHFMLIRDIYVILDSLTLVSTLWVIYMIRFKLKQTYMQELDNMPLYYVLVPSAVVAIIGHPGFGVNIGFRFFYMYSKTIEAVSVLPQLRLIQNAKVVEPFTAHYVFALGVARFLACANWLIMLVDSNGVILMQIGKGHLYVLVALLAEVVQTFILADFCYYYIKSVVEGRSMVRLPSMV
ncbi:hypothetical protein SOVF_049900 [Spinacia oleracea]|uniref:ER lumen protein-retaining receptor n=1 Tax=Spinacia oleracea TaxID=3562 RepID=A0A9R0JB30_SPIOL|nr:uncharacterized protein LOC110803328 [Spinacia oleracea]KNA20701.1 hypothetical protein SOVF_049900 [Spinacia oleracea]